LETCFVTCISVQVKLKIYSSRLNRLVKLLAKVQLVAAAIF
jgi:hypothetical protein